MDDRGNGSRDGGSTLADLAQQFDRLESTVDEQAKEQVREARAVAMEVGQTTASVFGNTIKGFDRADAAEAFVGAIIFGIPMFVESGTLEAGAFISTHPLYLVATVLIAVGIVIGLLYVADIQDVRITNPILGVFPRRLVGVVGISFGAAVLMMSAWGRVGWADPWLAFCQVSVAFVPMVIGAALGDILPGS
ncbi:MULTISPECIES: DUF2391 domain-containing protein [unclassified Haladaptatus]|uniref:DUF2391 domain-containing protein n=2 Tax=unclassified Haladaptatus TaxID=2622732 RepID=UPI0023E7853A|nr:MULTISPECIES: DUF2391 domain-containing protein [unclassified Haladaptatus]